MPKLYTKTGDNGTTYLYDGSKRQKNSIFFDVLGDLDELASHIGLLCANIYTSFIDVNHISVMSDRLREIQVKLLDIGSNIAVVNHEKKKMIPKLSEDDVKRIEDWIDLCEQSNDELTEFLLTGVGQTDSQCHICRSVTRRVERHMWMLHYDEVDVDENILKYINRLSDFFFAFSRNLTAGKEIKVSDVKTKLSSQ